MNERTADIQAQNICQSCGLCCDGSIFDTVRTEDRAKLEAIYDVGPAFQFVIRADETRFKQPCPAHDGARCRIYSHRPLVCREFTCKLLRRYQKQEIDPAAALAIIAAAKDKRDRAKAAASALGIDTSDKWMVDLFQKAVALAKSVETANAKAYGNLALLISVFRLDVNANFVKLEDEKAAKD